MQCVWTEKAIYNALLWKKSQLQKNRKTMSLRTEVKHYNVADKLDHMRQQRSGRCSKNEWVNQESPSEYPWFSMSTCVLKYNKSQLRVMFQQFIWERAKTEKKKEAKRKDKLHEKKKNSYKQVRIQGISTVLVALSRRASCCVIILAKAPFSVVKPGALREIVIFTALCYRVLFREIGSRRLCGPSSDS